MTLIEKLKDVHNTLEFIARNEECETLDIAIKVAREALSLFPSILEEVAIIDVMQQLKPTQSGQDKVIAKLRKQLRCCRENVRRLKGQRNQSILEEVEGMGWRDIATAPRDGTETLIFEHDGILSRLWDGSMGWADNVAGSYRFELTHWMPLASPPSPTHPAISHHKEEI